VNSRIDGISGFHQSPFKVFAERGHLVLHQRVGRGASDATGEAMRFS